MAGVVRADTFRMNTIKSQDSDVTAMSIDATGRILTPARPAFHIRANPAIAMTASGWRTVNLNGTKYTDIGNNVHADGYFVCPVDGMYQFNCRMRVDGVGGGYLIMALSDLITGTSPASGATTGLYVSTYHIDGSPPSNYQTVQTSVAIHLDANTKVQPWLYSTDTSITVNTTSTFSGFLVG